MFKKNLITYGSSAIIQKAISMFLFYLIISNLTIKEYGFYALKDIFKLGLTFIFTFGILDLAIPRFFMEENNKKEIFSHSIFIMLFYLFILIIIYLIYSILNIQIEYVIPISLIMISFIFEKFNDMSIRIFVFKDYAILNSIISNLIIIMNLVFFLILSKILNPLISILSAELISSFIIFLYLLWKFKEYIGVKFNRIKELISYSFPLLFNKFFKLINNSIDKLVLQLFFGLEVVGIYAFIQRIAMMFYSISNIFITSWSSISLNVYLKKNKENIDKIFRLILLLLLLLSIIFSIFSSLIASIFDKQHLYIEYYKYIPLYFTIILLTISYQIFGVFAIYDKNTKYILKIGAISSIINFIFSFTLCYTYGLVGVIIATILGTFIYTYMINKRSLSLIKENLYKYLYFYYVIIILNLGVYFVL